MLNKCKRLICLIFSQLCCDCVLHVHAGVVSRVEDNDAGPFDFQVKDGVMRPDAQLPSHFRRLLGMLVADAIVMVFWNNIPMWLRSQLVVAVGRAIQQQLAAERPL